VGRGAAGLLAALALAGCGAGGPLEARPTDDAASGRAASVPRVDDPAADPAAGDPLHRHLPAPAVAAGAARFETGELSDGAPFDAVLPSWNVPHGGLPFEVDVRVRTVEGAAWSPWLRIGDWNVEERASKPTVSFDGGRVAVDVLDLKAPADACELRFTFTGEAAPEGLDGIEAWVVLSDTSALEERVREAGDERWPGKRTRIDLPRRSQRVDGGEIGGRICSPTSTAMVLEHFGADVPTVELAHEIRDPHHGIFGNWNRAVQAGFDHGVRGRLVRVSSWETVAAFLRNGQPLVASIRASEGQLRGAPYEKTAGHLLVVRGLGGGGAVLVNDPAARSAAGVSRTYRRDDMEAVWFANGGVAYAFEPLSDEEAADGESRR